MPTKQRLAPVPFALPRERRLIVIVLVALDLSRVTDGDLTAAEVSEFLHRLGAAVVKGVGPAPRKVVVDVPSEEEREAS